MATMIGQIGEYEPEKEEFENYTKRLSCWMKINKIKNEDKVSVFLALVGPKAFENLVAMTVPDDPTDKSFEELTKMLGDFYKNPRNEITERMTFRERRQRDGESIAEYILDLKRLSRRCGYGATLAENLRDTFTAGLRDFNIRKKLLSVKDLTWDKAQEEALSMEMANQDAAQVSQSKKPGELNRVNVQTNPSSSKKFQQSPNQQNCGRCLGKHQPRDCPFLKEKCFKCGKVGHTKRACKTKTQNQPRNTNQWSTRRPQTRQNHPGQTNFVENTTEIAPEPEPEPEGDSYPTTPANLNSLYTGGSQNSDELKVTLEVDRVPLMFTIDTGATVSVINHEVYQQHLSHIPLKHSQYVLNSYSNNNVPVLGQIDVVVNYEGQEAVLPLVITSGNKVSLLGRNWMRCVKLNWKKVFDTFSVSNSSVQSVVNKYDSVFQQDVDKLNTIKNFQADVKLRTETTPVFKKARPVPYALRSKVEESLDKAEKEGILKKVKSSKWASPIVVVPKGNGAVRVCGDYKVTVNQSVEEDTYPLPTAEDLFATLAGGTVFTKLDLSNAYQQLELTEQSRELLTINTHKGLYQYQRLPYGVTTAPAIFQSVMDQMLNGLEHVCCFIDDILISSATLEEHKVQLEQVLQRLQENGVLVNKSKCEFAVPEVQYLGHRIDADGLHPTDEKVEAIRNAKTPTNVSELKTFLGIVTYYHRFIPNLSTTFAPLYDLLKKDTLWKWTSECDAAVTKVKEHLSSGQLLVHYDTAKPLVLATDASPHGVGAVISHIMENGEERPIAYASRSLTPAEKNYSQIEKEALGIIFGVRKFHKYLYGRKFTLVTDHQPLTIILSPKKEVPTLSALRLQRWSLILMSYNYTIQYRRSEQHGNADMLSRFPEQAGDKPLASELPINYFSWVNELPVTADDIREETRKDPLLSRVYHYTMNGWADKPPDPDLKPYFTRKDQLSTEQGCLLWGMRVIIPPKFRTQIIQELHHEHTGIVRMKALARNYLWYPGLDNDIECAAKACEVCSALRKNPAPAPFTPWTFPARVWERIHVDFATLKGTDYLILIDSHSKWIEVEMMNSTTASKTIEVIRHWFSSYGLPMEVVSDNGPQFGSAEFNDFLQRNGVKHTLSPPYHPSSNGAAERSVQIVKDNLKKHLLAEHKNLEPKLTTKQKLDNFLLTYRTIPHTITGRTPAELFLKREVRTRFSLLKPDLNRRVMEKQETQMRNQATPSTTLREFHEKEDVLVRDYTGGKEKWVQGTVTEKLGAQRYYVNTGTRTRHCHVDQMLKSYVKPRVTEVDDRSEEMRRTVLPLENSRDERQEVQLPTAESEVTPTTESTTQPTDVETSLRRYPARERRPPQRLIENM